MSKIGCGSGIEIKTCVLFRIPLTFLYLCIMEKKKRRIIAWSLVALLLLVIAWGISMAKRYFYDPVIDERAMVYIYPQWNESQLDSALQEVLVDEAAVTSVKQLLEHYEFDIAKRVGVYELHPDLSARKVALKLAKGSQKPVRVTFNNVRTVDQLAERVAEQLCFSKEDLQIVLHNDSLVKELGFTPATLPAMFLPDTYEFYWTVTPEAFIQKMKREYERFWQGGRKEKAEQLKLTPTEVATLASIVEEETNKADELGKVAALYMNRLRRGMLLQADPTVKFAYGDFSLKRVLNVHLAVESPYNTYRVTGLPPGPIRIPSKRGIDAVLNHKPHNYLYMCAREDFSGYHNFAVTLTEHNRNAARYQRELNRRGIR